MKNSIIEDIFRKKQVYLDCVKNSKEYCDISKEFTDLYNNLIKSLNEEQKIQFIKLSNLQTELEAEATFCFYKEGFKVGVLLFSECCQD